MPNNATLNAIRLGSGTLTTAADYQHNIHRDTVTNPFSTALMLESRKEGFSARKFAELIKRHPSTIYRELKRNSINDVY
ncbi:helix-turn-helix domain-containing protein, partial [Acinetobacter baumannii]|uniref:helix-turn-helix domain-containing protein n=1 Tax=Acinetobacter baumannii TaxID=470 RepID=UPI003D9CB940